MATVLRLLVMLTVGLLARAVVLPAGRRLAERAEMHVPALLSYAIAGTSAALVRLAVEKWSTLEGLPVWMIFGTAWGLVAGLLLPFARKAQRVTS